VAGAQNVGHLFNVMHFGESGTPHVDWLSTFIDDDVIMPPNAQEIFQMIGLYHNLGSIGLIAGGYTHHSGNPISLAQRALKYLVANHPDMTDEDIQRELDNLSRRTPERGLRGENASDDKYADRPEFTMVFPGGNYSLSGNLAFEIPVPIVGVDDLGYATMLQLFQGARSLGVARVPDFIHVRQQRPNGGDAHGTLEQFCTGQKDLDYLQFQKIAKQYAAEVAQVPQENIDGLVRIQVAKRRSQLRTQREVLQASAALAGQERFARYVGMLTNLKRSVHSFALAKYRASGDALDPTFVQTLVGDMVNTHAQLVDKAYQFGMDGELTKYNTAVKNAA
jgi:hypothetical protein